MTPAVGASGATRRRARSGRRALVVLALLWAALTATAAVAAPTVDLNAPGALEALRHANPAHHAKVRQILDGIFAWPGTDVPRWMQAAFDARDVSYVPVVLTSHPPKRRLSFVLDTTHYEAVVTLTNVRGDVVPAR